MTWLLGLTVGAVVLFGVVVARLLRSMPIERPNYEEKELTYTPYDLEIKPRKKGRKFFIRENGSIDVRNERTYCMQ